jgi:RNA polymerase sigma factor (sigma-70 family)
VENSIAQLTRGISAGDDEALETFYRTYFGFMLSQARKAIGSMRDEATVLDIVQDATMRVVRCVKPMETESHLLNWLRLVVKSCALDYLRSERQRCKRQRASSKQESQQEEMIEDERIDWLTAQISRLDPHVAELLTLRYREGLRLADIAAKFRCSTGMIDGKIRRAVDQLRVRATEVFDE